MNLQDCITFANEYPVASIATEEGDQPRVRLFAMWFADETGFYFHTGTIKSIYKQLQSNPKVELCFYNPGDAPGGGKMLRASGVVDFIDDSALKERLFEERPFLKAIHRGKHVGRSRSGYLQSAYGRSVVLDNGDQYARVRSRTNTVLNRDLVK
jgi:pyridoxamine 5'-phosphate oxidase